MAIKLKENWSKMTKRIEQVRLNSNQTLKKTVVASLVVSTISINTTAMAAENNKNVISKLQTVYHVYVGDLYLGTVSDKTKVNELIRAKISDSEERFEDYQLDYNTDDLTLIPEQSFRNSKVNEEEVLSYLDSKYELSVNAIALKVNGEDVLYLEDGEKLEKVLHMFKSQYVSEQDLIELEHQAKSEEPLPELQPGESRIIDIKLSEHVTTSIEEVSPEEVMNAEQAVQILQNGTLEKEKYVVKEGDVLSSIAAEHGLELKQLLELNPDIDENTILQIGDELVVTANQPYLEVIVEKEIGEIEPIAYDTKLVEDKDMYKGESKVVQKGSDGEKKLIYKIREQNGTQISKEILDETIVKEPITEIIHVGIKVVPSRGTEDLAWPTIGGYISSEQGYRWGRLHKGIDIARPENRSILAADNGTVAFAGWDAGYGNKIVIDHNNGMETVYAHLSTIHVSVGQTVQKGSKIGIMGSTGNSTGIHLHFEVYKDGELQNPLDYF